jgi:hypothetical protein
VRIVLAVVALWFAVAFLLGPLVGRVLKSGHIRPTGGPPPLPEPTPEPPPGEAPESKDEHN